MTETELPDLRIVYLLNGFAAGQQYVADVRQPTFEIATIYGIERYKIAKSPIGPEGYTATLIDEAKLPRLLRERML